MTYFVLGICVCNSSHTFQHMEGCPGTSFQRAALSIIHSPPVLAWVRQISQHFSFVLFDAFAPAPAPAPAPFCGTTLYPILLFHSSRARS